MTVWLNASAVEPGVQIVSSVPDLPPDLEICRPLPLVAPLFKRAVVQPENPGGNLGANRRSVWSLHGCFVLISARGKTPRPSISPMDIATAMDCYYQYRS